MEEKHKGRTEKNGLFLHMEELFSCFDALEGIVYVADMETHRLLAANRYCEEKHGTGLVGRLCFEALGRQEGGPCSFCTNDLLVGDDGEPASPVMWCFDDGDGGGFYRCVDRAVRWNDGRLVRMGIALDITDFREAEKQLNKSLHELGERVKELDCLYSVSKLMEKKDISLEAILEGTVALIPSGWQYPEITCVRITFGNQKFNTENFQETQWMQSSRIFADGEIRGTLDVGYVEEMPERYEGPFLLEERRLIDNLAEKLGRVIELMSAREELRVSEERFHLAAMGSQDGLWDWQVHQDAEWWSPRWYELLGYGDREIEASFSNFKSLLNPDDVGRMEEAVRAHFEEDVPFDMEYRLRTKSGEYRWFRGRGQVIRDSDGEPVRMAGSIQDITDMKLYESELKKSKRLFRDLVEKSLSGIVIIQDHRIVYMNPEVERLTGSLPPDFFVPDFEGVHPEDLEKISVLYRRLSEGLLEYVDTDFRFYRAKRFGERDYLKWVLCRGSVTEHNGREAIMLNLMDVTHAKEIEEIMQLQSKMASLGRVTAGIAHEIRNPLAGINIYLDALEHSLEKKESGKAREIIRKISFTSRKIESVINRVMDFSRPADMKLLPADIHGPIKEALKLSSSSLRKRGIRVQKHLAKNIPPCLADTGLLEQLVLNLIGNAQEAMQGIDGEKKIGIRSSVEGERIIVAVSDSGPGVPRHLRQEIFDPFFSTRKNNPGIGLSICSRIVTDHGGVIRVEESIWGGAEFVIEIPIAQGKGEDG